MIKKMDAKMKKFKRVIWDYYAKHRRSFPWRENITPYRVIVSEIMLQQTQVSRVVPKFQSFMRRFPDFETLAAAPLRDVLAEWQGLGYNRRGLQLKKLAEMVVAETKEKSGSKTVSKTADLPRTKEALMELPGIGPNTAGSVLAFAYNIPQAFIETNIRSVFIHFFFKKARRKIDDKEILKLVETSLLSTSSAGKTGKKITNPREWFYALMDYGAYLKSSHPNPSRKSKHHVRQSPFKGSNRELRARILRIIIEKPRIAEEIERLLKIKTLSALPIKKNLTALTKEGFIAEKNGIFHII
jgi:A/G-specific adenine glycosylase